MRTLFAEGLEELVLPKVDQVNARLDGIDRRLDKLESSVADLRANQGDLIDALQGKRIIGKPTARSLRARIFGRAA